MSDKRMTVEQALEYAQVTEASGDVRVLLVRFKNVASILARGIAELEAEVARLRGLLREAVPYVIHAEPDESEAAALDLHGRIKDATRPIPRPMGGER